MSTTANLNLQLPPDAAIPSDFLTTLNQKMQLIQTAFTTLSKPATATGTCLQGNHLNRLTQDATGLTPGTQFWESDRYSIYIVRAIGKTGTWAWEAGLYADVFINRPTDLGQSDVGFVFLATDTNTLYVWAGSVWRSYSSTIKVDTFANRPTGLSVTDAGLLYHCTTGTGGVAYNHTFEWSGTGWTVAERERLGGYFADYAKAPTEPGWQICDGSATHYLDIVAGALTEVAFTTPNMPGVYRSGGLAYTGALVLPAHVTLTGSTDAASAGTPTGAISVSGPSATVAVAAGSGSVVPTNIHIHTAVLAGDPMPDHQHTLTSVTGTFTGDPVLHLGVLVYFRR